MTSFNYEVKECPGCKCNYLAIGVKSFNSFGARRLTDGSMSNCSVRAEDFLVCPKCSMAEWSGNVKTIKTLSDFDYINIINRRVSDPNAFLESMPEFSGSSASDILSILKGEPWSCQDQERYLRLNLWRAVGRLHLKREGRVGVFRKYLEKQVSEHANSQPLKVAEALHELGRYEECMECLESPPLNGQLEANMIRLIELSKDSPLILAEIHRQLGRFNEAIQILSESYPQGDNVYAKRVAELAASGCKWLCEVE